MKRPETAEDWEAMTDSQVVTIGQDYGAHVSVAAQAEMVRRLIVALDRLRNASEKASRRLELLTAVLIVLTVVLVIEAIR
jgi:hypothetical protein